MSIKQKLNKAKEHLCIFHKYVSYSVARWFGPRSYVVGYSYKNNTELYIDARVVKCVVPNILDVITVVQKALPEGSADLRIISFTEAPAVTYNSATIDGARKLVERADREAEKIKNTSNTQTTVTPQEVDEDDEDISDMFK